MTGVRAKSLQHAEEEGKGPGIDRREQVRGQRANRGGGEACEHRAGPRADAVVEAREDRITDDAGVVRLSWA